MCVKKDTQFNHLSLKAVLYLCFQCSCVLSVFNGGRLKLHSVLST